MTTLSTERLLLRPVAADDLVPFHNIFSSPEAMRYWSTAPHSKLSQTEELIEAMLAASDDFGEDFVVEYENQLIGKAGFWKFPEIGYIFHPDYWGRGLAREALTAVLEYGFTQRSLKKAVADVDPRNTKSISLLKSLGFHESGREKNTIKVGDTWCDSVYFTRYNSRHE